MPHNIESGQVTGDSNSQPANASGDTQSGTSARSNNAAVSFKLGGKELAPEEVQSNLEAYEKLKREDGKRRNEMGELRNSVSRLEGVLSGLQKQPTAQQADGGSDSVKYDELFFEDPNKAFATLEQRIEKRLREEIDGSRRASQSDIAKVEATKKAWDGFYGSNSDLNTHRDLVDYVTSKLGESIRNLPVDEAFEVIAEESRKAIQKFKQNIELQDAETVNRGRNYAERGGYGRHPADVGHEGAPQISAKDLAESAISAIRKAKSKIGSKYSSD